MLVRVPHPDRFDAFGQLTNTPPHTARSANRLATPQLAARATLRTAQLGVLVFVSICDFVGVSAVSKRTECWCHCMLGRSYHPDRSGTSNRSAITPPHTARSANRLAGFQWQLERRFALLNLAFSCTRRFAALLEGMILEHVRNEQWHGRALEIVCTCCAAAAPFARLRRARFQGRVTFLQHAIANRRRGTRRFHRRVLFGNSLPRGPFERLLRAGRGVGNSCGSASRTRCATCPYTS